MNEGYIKFNCKQNGKNLISQEQLEEINKYRKKLYDLGFIGVYKNGIGFGNISIRTKDGFIISGSATGGIENLNQNHYSKVTFVDLDKNYLEYDGPIKASSESMTHAAVYESNNINAVIHIHNLNLWKKLLNKVPTTDKEITYGTPEMAYEMKRILKTTKENIIITAGHEEGLFIFGENLKQALNILLSYN